MIPVPEAAIEAVAAILWDREETEQGYDSTIPWTNASSSARATFMGVAASVLTAALPFLAEQIEAPWSPLCDCSREENPPTLASDRSVIMSHHCDCRAVETAAAFLGAYSLTAHCIQCGCGGFLDEILAENMLYEQGRE